MTQEETKCPVNEQDPQFSWLSPLFITLMTSHAFFLGGFATFLWARRADGPTIMLLVATGVIFGIEFVLAISDSRRYRASLSKKQNAG